MSSEEEVPNIMEFLQQRFAEQNEQFAQQQQQYAEQQEQLNKRFESIDLHFEMFEQRLQQLESRRSSRRAIPVNSDLLQTRTDENCIVQNVVNDMLEFVEQQDVQSESFEAEIFVDNSQVVMQHVAIDPEMVIPNSFGKETTANDATDVIERMSVVPFSVFNYSVFEYSLFMLIKQDAACYVFQFLTLNKSLSLLLSNLVFIAEHGPGPPLIQ